jgi:hypothetical protein
MKIQVAPAMQVFAALRTRREKLRHLHVIARESGRSSNHLIRRRLLDAPLSPEGGLGLLRRLLSERKSKTSDFAGHDKTVIHLITDKLAEILNGSDLEIWRLTNK